jgi:hypothetical protein
VQVLRFVAVVLVASSFALTAHADPPFKVSAKLSCSTADSGKFDKSVLTNDQIIAAALNVSLEVAKTDTLVMDGNVGGIYIVSRCDGSFVRSLGTGGAACNYSAAHPDPSGVAKYAEACRVPITDWEGTPTVGRIQCEMTGKNMGTFLTTGGRCTGVLALATTNCDLSAHSGAAFKPSGSCF